MEYTYDDSDRDPMLDAFLIAFIICVECAKEPDYRCEICDKTYKQEGRYKAHIAMCDTRGDAVAVAAVAAVAAAADFSELLRQNREMIELMRKQQETIQLLVAKLIPAAGVGSEMNIE
jgi:ribosomal protein L37AE/L43A